MNSFRRLRTTWWLEHEWIVELVICGMIAATAIALANSFFWAR